jgi:ParB family chromosome partitioning protein
LIPTAPREAEQAPDTSAQDGTGGAGPGQHDGTTAATSSGSSSGAPQQLVGGSYFTELPPSSIHPNAVQPRQVFEEEAMAELVTSIREVGLLQPIVVRPDGDGFELVMGERRWRASQQAGLEKIPAIVRETGDDDMLRDALLENLHRSQLNPLEEAAAYGQLLEDFGVLSAGHARSLLAVEDPELQDRLAGRVVSEGISVRGLEEIVAVGELGGAPARTRRNRPVAPGLGDIAERLSDRFETRVKVDLGKAKGKITVEFASLQDLQRIVDVMDPRNRNDRPI